MTKCHFRSEVTLFCLKLNSKYAHFRSNFNTSWQKKFDDDIIKIIGIPLTINQTSEKNCTFMTF